MARHMTFDDPRVGQQRGNNFKVTGSEDHRQRVAYIPGEAFFHELVVTPELQKRAFRPDLADLHKRAAMGDARAQTAISDMETAQQEIDDIGQTREKIQDKLKSNPPAAQFWVNEKGEKVVLHPKLIAQDVIWVKGVGPVVYRQGVPPELLSKEPETNYGFVILEYELDQNDNVVLLSPDRQVDLGGGHKLTFKYTLKPWMINGFKAKSWKEHTRKFPTIFSDYEVWEIDKNTDYPKVKFAPIGPALWRQDPLVMQKIIREARKIYADLPKTMARDFSLEELIELLSSDSGKTRGGHSGSGTPVAPSNMEMIDFAAMLGGGTVPESQATPALEQGQASPDLLVHGEVDSFSPTDEDLTSLLPQESSEQEESLASLFPN